MMTIAQILTEHVERGYMFGPDRLMTVTCACGATTAADDYEAENAHRAAEEVHARHQEAVLRAAFPSAPVTT